MDFDDLSKEQKVLVVMRKTLTSIIRDTTPNPGMIHPLSESSVENIKLSLSLIASRERELNIEQGDEQLQRPHFVDEDQGKKQTEAQVIKFQARDQT
jgi:hypothetical protein